MGITIQEALKLPVMAQTSLVAGHQGLQNVIKWVTIVEVIEDITRLQEGEFLITTGFGLLESDEKRTRFLTLLSNRQLSGVAIYTGFYLEEIPESFIGAADDHALPLIEIPTNINFSMITKAILEQIVNKQMSMFEHSLNIHRELTNLVLEDRGIEPITRTLSHLIKASIILLNDDMDITDYHILHEDIVLHDRGKEDLEWLKESLSIHSLHLARNLKSMILPIIANGVNYGSIVTIKEQSEWKEMDQLAIEHAATVYAIEFLKRKAVKETEIRLTGDFLDDILHKNFKDPTLAIERGKKLGFDLTLNQAALRIKIDNPQHHWDHQSFTDSMDRLLQTVQNVCKKNNRQFLVRNKLDELLILAEVEPHESKTSKVTTLELAKLIEQEWMKASPLFSIRIGIGRNYHDIHLLSQSARESQYALNFGKLLLKPKNIVHYEDLGLYHLLVQMQEMGMNLQEFYEANIGPLTQMKRQGADLILTLETYLLNNQSMNNTAAELFIHRHTLKYRLNQIEKKTGLNINSADDRMKLQLAVMAYKLCHSPDDGQHGKNTLIL